jgi:hypothetical protein
VETLIGKLEQAHKDLERLTKLEATVLRASLPSLGFSGTIMESLKHLNLDSKT